MSRIGGTLQLQIDGEVYAAKGNFTYSPGGTMATGVVGNDGVHGYTEEHQIPYIEGEITDRGDLDLKALKAIRSATVTLDLANGKMFVLRDAWFAAEAVANTQEGNVPARFEGLQGDEVAAS